MSCFRRQRYVTDKRFVPNGKQQHFSQNLKQHVSLQEKKQSQNALYLSKMADKSREILFELGCYDLEHLQCPLCDSNSCILLVWQVPRRQGQRICWPGHDIETLEWTAHHQAEWKRHSNMDTHSEDTIVQSIEELQYNKGKIEALQSWSIMYANNLKRPSSSFL